MKDKFIQIRVSEVEKEQIKKNAKREGLKMTAFLLKVALNPKRYIIFADQVVLGGEVCLEN